MTRIAICLGFATLVTALFSSSAHVLAQDSSTDRAALVALYNATGGPNWKNNDKWLSDAPIGEWHGVVTNDNGRVIGLNLFDNHLDGTIPAELGSISTLEWLGLSDNQLRGEIPSELGNLTNLTELSLDSNQLSGEIPRELNGLANLQSLRLNCNQFSGEIPPTPTLDPLLDEWLDQIAEQARVSSGWGADGIGLVELYNATCGSSWENNTNWLSDAPIGEWYGVTTNSNGRVTELVLVGNGLSGTIPAELGGLANLRRLALPSNQLNGKIPPELGNLSNLQGLDLSNNELSGKIPPELENLAGLVGLNLSENKLSGDIPQELGNLANVEGLYLSRNRLTGCIPQGLQDLQFNDFSDLGLTFCTMGDQTPVSTRVPTLASTPTPISTRTSDPAPTSTASIERGFFFNSNPVRTPEAGMPFNLLDPVTLSLIGIILTLIATSIQLFKGR